MGIFFRYLVARLVIGQYKQLTSSQKFLFFLRKAIYDGPWESLINDVRYLISDTDQKVTDVCTFFTMSNMQQKLDLLQHRLKSTFSLCFKEEREQLTRFFRLNLRFEDKFLTGCEILEDVGSWTDIHEEPDIMNMVYGIIGDLEGNDIQPHQIERAIQVNFSPVINFHKILLNFINSGVN